MEGVTCQEIKLEGLVGARSNLAMGHIRSCDVTLSETGTHRELYRLHYLLSGTQMKTKTVIPMAEPAESCTHPGDATPTDHGISGTP